MLVDILSFSFRNISSLLIIIFILISVYSWITIFKNKDLKFITQYDKKYVHGVLTPKDLRNIKHQIKYMDGRKFEIFSQWLFKNMEKYKTVTLTPAEYDEGKDLILIDNDDNTIFVECKRYTESATFTEQYMIGREICQKLVGAIVADGITNGIIITTGNIHKNAWNYIVKLEKNSNIKIDIITLDEIMRNIQQINDSEVLNVVGLQY